MKTRIGKIRFGFLLHQLFLGELAIKLIIKEDNALVSTMGTDGKYLIYNTEFVGSINDNDLKGVIAHEVGHILFGHAYNTNNRWDNYDKNVLTLAKEFMANHFAIDLCGLTLPGPAINEKEIGKKEKGYLYSTKYSDGSWDTISVYFDLMQHENVPKSKSINYCIDDHGSFNTQKGESAGAQERDWKIAIAQAAYSELKQRGTLPLGIAKLVDKILDAKLPWYYYLAEFVVSQAKNDYTWRRPNRRQLWKNIYAPSLNSETINILFAMDTSGSMFSEEDLSSGLSELREICTIFPSYKLYVVACDSKVHFFSEVSEWKEIDIAGLCTGGGGTAFKPVFDKVKEEDITLDVLIYFTDLEGDVNIEAPDYPVMWITKSSHGESPKFGRIVKFE